MGGAILEGDQRFAIVFHDLERDVSDAGSSFACFVRNIASEMHNSAQ